MAREPATYGQKVRHWLGNSVQAVVSAARAGEGNEHTALKGKSQTLAHIETLKQQHPERADELKALAEHAEALLRHSGGRPEFGVNLHFDEAAFKALQQYIREHGKPT